jgi:hypothetical protein
MKSIHRRFLWRRIAPITAALLLAFGACEGSDWPHYRGPTPDGVSTDRVLTNWPKAGPRQPKDHFELLVGDSAGTGLSTQRIPHIELLAATNLSLPVANWIKLPNPVVMTNGMLLLDDSNSTRFSQRFFMGIEQQ